MLFQGGHGTQHFTASLHGRVLISRHTHEGLSQEASEDPGDVPSAISLLSTWCVDQTGITVLCVFRTDSQPQEVVPGCRSIPTDSQPQEVVPGCRGMPSVPSLRPSCVSPQGQAGLQLLLFNHCIFCFAISFFFLVTMSYPTLHDPRSCSLPVSSVHGISQARILKWVAVSFSRGLPDPGI